MNRQIIILCLIFAFCSQVYASDRSTCSVKVRTKQFIAKEHTFTYWKNSKVITKIDGLHYSGSDGYLPDSELQSIELTVDEHNYQVEEKAFKNLYNLSCPTNDCTLKCEPKKPVIVLTGGDGAGAYAVYYYFDLNNMHVERISREHPDARKPEVSFFELNKSK